MWTSPRSATPGSTRVSVPPTSSGSRWPARYCPLRSVRIAAAAGTERCSRRHRQPTAGRRRVVASLANDRRVGAVVLSSNELPHRRRGTTMPSAGRRADREQSVSVLLADARHRQPLGSRRRHRPETGQFGYGPGFPRADRDDPERGANLAASLVIAPPTGWDPSPAEAAALLSISHGGAPWLRPVSLSALTTDCGRAAVDPPLPAKRVSGAELSSGLPRPRAAGPPPAPALFTNLLASAAGPRRRPSPLQAAVTADRLGPPAHRLGSLSD